MEIIPKNNSEILELPLPIFKTIHIADAVSRDGEKFYIVAGLDKEIISQLKTLSLDSSDTELQKNTSDMRRFGIGAYQDWYNKNRTPFALLQTNTNMLAALVWLGPDPLVGEVGNWHTIAWRSYPLFRGKGLMKNFTKFAIGLYLNQTPNAKIWAIIKSGNEGSAGFATSLGFKKLKEGMDNSSIFTYER